MKINGSLKYECSNRIRNTVIVRSKLDSFKEDFENWLNYANWLNLQTTMSAIDFLEKSATSKKIEEVASSCPLCGSNDLQLLQHLQEACSCKNNIKKISHASILYEDETLVCLKCFKKFDAHGWKQHSKNKATQCKKMSSSRVSIPSEIDSIPNKSIAQSKIQLSTIKAVTPSKQHYSFISITMNSLDGPELPQLFLEHLKTSISVGLVEWLSLHKQIKKSLLFKIFSKYCEKITDQLQQIFPKPTFSQLYLFQKSVKWTQLLNNAEQIFNRQLMLKKLENLTIKQQNKCFSAMNKLLELYPKVIDKYQLFAREKPKSQRDKRPLLPKQFIEVVYTLISSKKRDCVHIGLDLMIIYQSGQRFPSDINSMTSSLLSYLSNPHRPNYFVMMSCKLKKQVQVTLDEQLIKLLVQFKWSGFYRTSRFYKRLYQVFPFPVYSLRRGFISYLFLYVYGSNEAVRLLSGHSRQKTSSIYFQKVQRHQHLQLKQHLRIPNLTINYTSTQQTYSKLPVIADFTDKIILQDGWFSKVLASLRKTQFSQIQVNYLFQDHPFIEYAIQIQKDNRQLVPLGQDNQLYSQSPALQEIEQVSINEVIYRLVNGKFNLIDLYKVTTQGICQVCDTPLKNQGLQCQTCTGQYHNQCCSKFCSCFFISQQQRGIFIQSSSESGLILDMPQDYIKQNHEELDQLRFLIHSRGFYYTNTAICHQSVLLSPPQFQQHPYQQIKLPLFHQYQQYKYLPPIRLKVTHNSNLNGSGFGIFATAAIKSNIFIGQYAADIFTNFNSILVKRFDSIMELHSDRSCKRRLSIGPISYCGYICLINQSQSPNCAAITGVINKQLRVILYTIRNIKEGEELTYSYTAADNLNNQQANSPIQLKDYSSRDIGIRNIKQNCYINSVLQAIKYFKSHLSMNDIEGHANPLITELLIFFRQTKQYDPSNFLRCLQISCDKLPFNLGKQDDAHTFLMYILEKIQQERDISCFKGVELKSIQCKACQTIQSNSTQFLDQRVPIDQQLTTLKWQNIEQIYDYDCRVCNDKCKASIKTQIVAYPQILIIQLMRFNNSLQKDCRGKIIPQTLSFHKFNYKRKFIILHKGKNLQYGHFTAFNSKLFIQFDDRTVKRVSSMRSQQAYLLFYEKADENG